jgi:hypothetical protein
MMIGVHPALLVACGVTCGMVAMRFALMLKHERHLAQWA